MLGIEMRLDGDIDLDTFEVDVECPRCGFANTIWMRQARLRDVVICRGCKANIQLDDSMNSVRKAHRSIRRAMQDLRDTIAKFNRK
ncbi:MAG TPA: hypothetical protein PKD86_00275 [Gemmatales bacterium]|nr:hypothetical protein [Gemmatales bacterium]